VFEIAVAQLDRYDAARGTAPILLKPERHRRSLLLQQTGTRTDRPHSADTQRGVSPQTVTRSITLRSGQ
jgi:hypothetical protein